MDKDKFEQIIEAKDRQIVDLYQMANLMEMEIESLKEANYKLRLKLKKKGGVME